jgi:S-layer homology domain
MGQTQHEQLQDQAMPWRRSLTKVRRMRRLTVVGVAALILAVPIAVSASHIFSDVPTSNTFHTSISTLYGARITGGCGSGKYCPNDPVTRGQMAAFLVRGLGRVATVEDGGGDDWEPLTQPAPGLGQPHPYAGVAPISFRHGGGTGGSGRVFVVGTVNVYTDEVGVCPCEVQAFIFNDTTADYSPTYFGMIGSDFAPIDPDISLIDPPITPTAFAEMTMTIDFAFDVDSGVVNDYGIGLKVIPTTAPTVDPDDDHFTGWHASLQTLYVPFDENGANPPGAPTTQSQPQRHTQRFDKRVVN